MVKAQTAPGSIPGGVTGDFFQLLPPTEHTIQVDLEVHKI